jgi:hypothetical protein
LTEEALEEKNDPGRRKTRRAAEKSAAVNSEIARADRADSNPPSQSYYLNINTSVSTNTTRTATVTGASKPSEDRSVVAAAGGMAYVASMEKLPPETGIYSLSASSNITNSTFS